MTAITRETTAERTAVMSDFPARIGRYELLVSIGSGGMARVFLARSTGAEGFERDVALKLLHPHLRELPEFKTGLLDEARVAAGVRHPNVVQIIDVVEDEAGVYLVMEYVDGDTLSGLVRTARARGERLPPSIAVRVLSDALAGLHAAHELTDRTGAAVGLVHRDFSPQNILVGIDGTSRLTDFGIVKASGRISHTRTGLVKGKVRYMSPEQARAKPIDRRADVWAAGVVAWELFADRPLYPPDEDDASTLLRVVSESPPRLSSAWPAAPPELEQAVSWALEPDPSRRCPSADQFRKRLLSAWSSVGDVADTSEVADYAARATEQKRARRQTLAGAVRARRASAESIADAETKTPFRPLVPVSPALASEPSSEPMSEAGTVNTPIALGAVPARQTRFPVARAALIASGTVLLLGAAIALARTGDDAPAEASSVTAHASEPAAASAALPAAEPPTARVRNNQIRVISDRAISRLQIGARVIAIAPPERDVTLRLTDLELDRDERVVATAKDGRKMQLTVDATADIIEIDFAAARQIRRKSAHRPPPPLAPKPSGTSRAPLAPNPYGAQP